jgi:hypothetical protein
MKPQSKFLSFVESASNAIIGILSSFFMQALIFPFFEIHINTITNIKITLVFFVVSIIRSFILRRLFNSIR